MPSASRSWRNLARAINRFIERIAFIVAGPYDGIPF
jgi:hypothetical protein